MARILKAYEAAHGRVGGDIYYGRQVYGDVLARGLAEVQGEGHVEMARGGSRMAGAFLCDD